MTRFSMIVAALGLCAVSLATSQASADNGDWRGSVNGWTFKPAVINQHVVGFIGWADAAAVVGDNISTVWLQRGANDTWTSWAWKSGDFAKAIDSIRPWGAWACAGSTTTPAGVTICSYARTATRTRTFHGALFNGCGACPPPATETLTETGVIRLTGGTCICDGTAVPVSTGEGTWQ